MASPPSGAQHEIALGEQRATVVEVGGGIRSYAVGDRDVLDPYPAEAICDGAHGAPLIPWPNRLEDGVYEFDGERRQVDLTEPEKHNAIHGFLRWRNWEPVEHEPARVVMGTRLHPLPGYPHPLEVQVAYELGDEGLTVTTAITNAGDGPCPIGAGQHPYLSPGAGAVLDDCTVQLHAATRILTDAERQLPTGREAVDGTAFDFREPRRLGDQQVDFAFCDLQRDGEGRAWTRLTGPDGATAAQWVDEAYPYVELYTGDTLAPERRRRGLGCEPMTCAPNAFRSGEGLRRLEAGERLIARWGARLT
ncbi:MAG: aldose epimerase [Solirubrobacteraceae bacterium]|nr:aldose epimerase [Solirubrobacteraceae bacterium]